MAIVTDRIDLAKNVFAVHGVDAAGRPVLLFTDWIDTTGPTLRPVARGGAL